MKYFIHLAYKGTQYSGWQRQPTRPSIQETLENALLKMTGKKINCIGCGRTDAGVHASQFFCHVKVDNEFAFDPVFRLNKMLPDDISIFDFIVVDKGAHAQHDVVSRTYTYRVHTTKNAFLSEVSTFYTIEGLNLDLMQQAIELLPQNRDFRSVCKQPNVYKNTIVNIHNSKLSASEGNEQLVFKLTADRFLRGMVRILIGNILEIGYGNLPLSSFEQALQSGVPLKFFNIAYPQGLYLSKVKYPYLDI